MTLIVGNIATESPFAASPSLAWYGPFKTMTEVHPIYVATDLDKSSAASHLNLRNTEFL